MRRRLWIVLPFLAAMLIVAHTAAWLAATAYLQRGFKRWEAQRQAAGWQIEAGPPARGGWPLAATLTLPNLAMAAGRRGAPGEVTWHAATVVLGLSVRHPRTLTIDLAGPQTVRIAPGPPLRFTAEQLQVDAPLMRTRAPAASLVLRQLRGEGLRIGLLTGLSSLDATPALSVSVEAVDLPGGPWPLGPHISSLAADATLAGGLPPPGTPAASAAAWHQAGGALEISHFALGWGPLGVAASGRLALDDRLQPEGRADLRLIGYAKALDALAAQHVITKDAALAATAVATLLARVPPDGGAPEVELPLTLGGGKLLLGHTPLLKLPELHWPGE